MLWAERPSMKSAVTSAWGSVVQTTCVNTTRPTPVPHGAEKARAESVPRDKIAQLHAVAYAPPEGLWRSRGKRGDRTIPGREPFYLIVTDGDRGTFSVEGPMTDDRLWNHAVVVAQKAGRQVRCLEASGSSAEDTARTWLQRYSGKQVPPGEIVHL